MTSNKQNFPSYITVIENAVQLPVDALKHAVQTGLRERGCVALRGLPVDPLQEVVSFIESLGVHREKYIAGNNPRKSVHDDRLYFSTTYPPSWKITLHSETSHLAEPAEIIGLFSRRTAQRGGQTILASTKELVEKMPEDILTYLRKDKISYVQRMRDKNQGFGFGRPWQDVFYTESKLEVEKYCHELNIGYAWEGHTLVAEYSRPALRPHPATGEDIWFNQAEQWHNSNIDQSVIGTLKEKIGDQFPHHSRFASGEEFDLNMLKRIRDVYDQLSFPFPWKDGDLLLINNFSVAHGRLPYEGSREVLFFMGKLNET